MIIDLTSLHNNFVSSVDISGQYDIDNSYYANTDIIRLSSIKVEGSISRRENDDFILDDYVKCRISGEMILADSISLEEVNYPFSIKYEDFVSENCRKNENSIDILLFLWENIVLEVPLQFTKVEDLSKFHGDGWKLISEDQLKTRDNPFTDLLKDFEKE